MYYQVSTQDKYEKFAADDQYKLWSLSEGWINYMGFNANSALTADPKVRKDIC